MPRCSTQTPTAVMRKAPGPFCRLSVRPVSMERLLQYMDDLDDLAGAFGLVYERVRRLFLALIAVITGLLSLASGIWLALVHPPIALATCLLLFVSLLYRAVTSPSQERLQIN